MPDCALNFCAKPKQHRCNLDKRKLQNVAHRVIERYEARGKPKQWHTDKSVPDLEWQITFFLFSYFTATIIHIVRDCIVAIVRTFANKFYSPIATSGAHMDQPAVSPNEYIFKFLREFRFFRNGVASVSAQW